MEVYTVLKNTVAFPIIANIPHSSTFIPPKIRNGFLIGHKEFERELLLLTDRYVDELFSAILKGGGILVKYNCSRIVVDPERFEYDREEEMSKVGMGVIYVKTSDGRDLRNKPGQTEDRGFLKAFTILITWL